MRVKDQAKGVRSRQEASVQKVTTHVFEAFSQWEASRQRARAAGDSPKIKLTEGLAFQLAIRNIREHYIQCTLT